MVPEDNFVTNDMAYAGLPHIWDYWRFLTLPIIWYSKGH
jgi:hypothetical protein